MGYGNETYTKRKSLKGKRKKKSPGLVVMGENYCSRGCVFESQLRILDGLFQIILLYTFFGGLSHLKMSFFVVHFVLFI